MPTEISVQDLHAKLAAGDQVYLLDVRQAWEHEIAALPGSVLTPLDQLPALVAGLTPPEGAEVVAYCHHGMRSLAAAAFLESAGFPGVASLAGGIDEWSRAIDPKVPRYR